MLALFSFWSNAALVKSSGSGNWGTGGTWISGSVPACGDSVVIQAGHNITVNSNVNLLSGCALKMAITISGTLTFSGGKKLDLPCNSRIYLFANAAIAVSGGGSSNSIDICGTNYWNSGSGNLPGPSCLPPTLPGCATVLPIELFQFGGKVCGPAICLDWKTQSEKNNSHFVVQKTADGRNFNDIGRVESQANGGKSSSTLEYTFEDQSPTAGYNYYRLLQTDIDGKQHPSPLIVVEAAATEFSEITLYPNPGTGYFTVDAGRRMDVMTLDVSNCLGEKVFSTVLYDGSKINFIMESPGVYICSVGGSGHAVFRLVVR